MVHPQEPQPRQRFGPGNAGPIESRSQYQRDHDRVLYSSAFSRLSGVTQVAAVGEHRVLHNRHTHSLKVALIGRRLAERLLVREFEEADLGRMAGVNPDVVETAGLAHDLGHPPFGHVAEETLNVCLAGEEAPEGRRGISGLEGFEGNAQTFRVLTKLARHKDPLLGLDLQPETLNAVLKYPQSHSDIEELKSDPAWGMPWTDRSFGSKWGFYKHEAIRAAQVRQDLPGPESREHWRRSACAILMDWADDISYATHDIEDYFRAGLIPLHDPNVDELSAHGTGRLAPKNPGFDQAEFLEALQEVVASRPVRRYTGTTDDRYKLHRFTSQWLDKFVKAVRPIDVPPYIMIDERAQYLAEALKELTWYYVIESPALAMMQRGQQKLIETLFDQLYDWLKFDPRSSRLPVGLRQLYVDVANDGEGGPFLMTNGDARCAQTAVDYICSLTEAQAMDIFERLSGTSRSSIFGAWFH